MSCFNLQFRKRKSLKIVMKVVKMNKIMKVIAMLILSKDNKLLLAKMIETMIVTMTVMMIMKKKER